MPLHQLTPPLLNHFLLFLRTPLIVRFSFSNNVMTPLLTLWTPRVNLESLPTKPNYLRGITHQAKLFSLLFSSISAIRAKFSSLFGPWGGFIGDLELPDDAEFTSQCANAKVSFRDSL